jgi:hypothetical protein
LGIAGTAFGASLPGAWLRLGEEPIGLPVSGDVDGEADGVRSRFGFSPTRFESEHPTASPVSSANAQNLDKTLLIVSTPLYVYSSLCLLLSNRRASQPPCFIGAA